MILHNMNYFLLMLWFKKYYKYVKVLVFWYKKLCTEFEKKSTQVLKFYSVWNISISSNGKILMTSLKLYTIESLLFGFLNILFVIIWISFCYFKSTVLTGLIVVFMYN